MPRRAHGQGTSSGWVELGRLGSPFGVKGWVRVRSFTDPPAGMLDFARWTLRTAAGERSERRLLEGRAQGKGLVVHLEGVDGRDAAAALGGAWVEIAREQLPAPGARQFYRADLLGLAVRNLEGVELGAVLHFVEAPAGPVMVVQDGAEQRWIPAMPPHLRQVDLDAGRIIVDWPARLE